MMGNSYLIAFVCEFTGESTARMLCMHVGMPSICTCTVYLLQRMIMRTEYLLFR